MSLQMVMRKIQYVLEEIAETVRRGKNRITCLDLLQRYPMGEENNILGGHCQPMFSHLPRMLVKPNKRPELKECSPNRFGY